MLTFQNFKCLSGSATILLSRVNDNYCDCADGSDEPGTSACPNGRFFCANKGYKGMFTPSSTVDDSICGACSAVLSRGRRKLSFAVVMPCEHVYFVYVGVVCGCGSIFCSEFTLIPPPY